MEAVGCSETSARNYHYTLRINHCFTAEAWNHALFLL